MWKSRDLSPEDVSVALETTYENYKITIFQHTVSGNRHYGLVAVPDDKDKEKFPVALINHGVDIKNRFIPVEDFLKWLGTERNGVPTPLSGFILLIPAYRGQALKLDTIRFEAEGDFRDIIDGAADDAIGLLNVARDFVPEGKYGKIFAFGHGTGGTISLMTAERDLRINTVFVSSTPVNFYKYDMQQLFGDELYSKLFIRKSNKESRRQMLASSPVFFPVSVTVENIYLIYGTHDTYVPMWNMGEIYAHLSVQDIDVNVNIIKRGNLQNLLNHYEYTTNFRAAAKQFLKNLDK